MGATITLIFLFGHLGFLKHGQDTDIRLGQTNTVFVDQDVTLLLPIPAPP